MAGSPPLKFIAPSTFTPFAPGSFAPQQVVFCDPGAVVGYSGAPPFEAPFSSSTDTQTQAIASLHERYHTLLSHERQGKDLERSVWEAERLLFVERIATLEDTVRDLQGQLGKPQPGVAAATNGLVKSQVQSDGAVDTSATTTATATATTTSTMKDLPGGLVDVHLDVAAPHVGVETMNEQVAEHVPPSAPVVAHEGSPVEEEEPRDGLAHADSPGPPEYPCPKTPKSVKGDVEPDESEIVNLLDQAGRILGKTSYGMNHYDNEYDDPEEDFKLILKPNRNFRSNWAF